MSDEKPVRECSCGHPLCDGEGIAEHIIDVLQEAVSAAYGVRFQRAAGTNQETVVVVDGQG